MSRSYRKVPICAFCNAGSMKLWRREVNKRHRHNQKQRLNKYLTYGNWDEYIPRVIREDGNPYDSPKDGSYSWWDKPHENEWSRWWNIQERIERWKKIFRK